MSDPREVHFGPIPEQKWDRWDPQYIFHARLEMELAAMPQIASGAVPTAGKVRFSLTRVTPPENTGVDIEAYALKVANQARASRPKSTPLATPWDVPVDAQCWLLFELDEVIENWQFYGYGIVPKKGTGYDFGVRHAIRGDTKVRSGSIHDDGCRVIYLGIGQRDPYAHKLYNLLVEFLHDAGVRMPVIFDPDVPNLGGSHIP